MAERAAVLAPCTSAAQGPERWPTPDGNSAIAIGFWPAQAVLGNSRRDRRSDRRARTSLTGELPPPLAGRVAHSTSTTDLLVRVVVAFALTYALGYERELRGSPAGDRTFSLIGTASAVLGNLAGAGSPNAIAGAVTGIGFIGGGIVVRRAVRTGEIISGITTAASIFATAAIGAAAGAGLLAVAALATGLVLVALEGPHLPLLRLVDARRWSPRFRDDEELYRDDDTAVLPDTTPPADRDQQTSPTSDDVGPRVRGLPPATIASGNDTTGAIAFLFAVARGGLE